MPTTNQQTLDVDDGGRDSFQKDILLSFFVAEYELNAVSHGFVDRINKCLDVVDVGNL